MSQEVLQVSGSGSVEVIRLSGQDWPTLQQHQGTALRMHIEFAGAISCSSQ